MDYDKSGRIFPSIYLILNIVIAVGETHTHTDLSFRFKRVICLLSINQLKP